LSLYSENLVSNFAFKFNLHDRYSEGIIRQFAVPANVDFISFGAIRAASTIHNLKRMLKEWGLATTKLIAQIDNVHALRDLPNVLKEADVILLARGELGAVVAPEKMFAVQKHVLRMCERIGRPCIVTRLMDSMILAPRPTRAEATDVANIVLDGADGLLLGLETLEGKFPLLCLETVLAIAREADAAYDYEARYRRQMQQMNVKLAKATDSAPWGLSTSKDSGSGARDGRASPPPVPRVRANSQTVRLEQFEPQVNLKKEALAAAAVQTAYQIEAKIIVVFSHTGETTRLVAKYHPQCPILSLSIPTVRGGTLKWQVEGDVEARQQLVIRGVVPALSAGHTGYPDERNLVTHQVGATRTDVEAMTKAAALGLIRPGELAVFCQLIAGLSTVKAGGCTSSRIQLTHRA
jgi:pyruvate kinase